MRLSGGSAATATMGTVSCLTTARSIAASSLSAGTGYTATTSKTPSCRLTGNSVRKSQEPPQEKRACFAIRFLCRRQRTSGIVPPAPQSRSGSKPPSASGGNGRPRHAFRACKAASIKAFSEQKRRGQYRNTLFPETKG